ncbi:MAG: hypothetical protein FJ030_15850 [Chloroflexi bacterium]|nr:hypothetical protein [Chloroflexota bacterium]
MTTSSNPNTDSMPEWYDPFAEPNTIPGGWDLSDFAASARADGDAHENDRDSLHHTVPHPN